MTESDAPPTDYKYVLFIVRPHCEHIQEAFLQRMLKETAVISVET